MRRSKSIRLVLLGATAVTLGACGDEDLSQGEYFTDEAQCRRVVEGDACGRALAEARQRHMATAPQFATVADCEREYGNGNCEMGTQAAAAPPNPTPTPTTGAGSTGTGSTGSGTRFFYIPAMSGFTYSRNGAPGGMGAPVWRDRAGNAFTGRTQVGRFSSGGSFEGTSRRGGFGSFARSGGS